MVDINIVFCRHLLSQAVKELKEKHPNVRPMKDAWVWHAGRDHWEFHGPAINPNPNAPRDKFYWHGTADNAYEARYKGWMAWIDKKDEMFANDVQERVSQMRR